MTRFVPVLERDRLRPDAVAEVECDGFRIALVDLGDRVVAFEAACLRCGVSLATAVLVRPIAACAGCGWRYDLAEARVVGLPALRLHTLEVRILRGAVQVASAAAEAPRDRAVRSAARPSPRGSRR